MRRAGHLLGADRACRLLGEERSDDFGASEAGGEFCNSHRDEGERPVRLDAWHGGS
jgi:hypothetical protein